MVLCVLLGQSLCWPVLLDPFQTVLLVRLRYFGHRLDLYCRLDLYYLLHQSDQMCQLGQ